MKNIVLVCFFCALIAENVYGMTEAQMKAALKLIRKTCQPKNKATDEQIDDMHEGNWDQDKNGMCYMRCVLDMYRLMTKENKFDWENAIVTLKAQAPESLRETATASVMNCKDSVQTPDDKCKSGFEVAKCFYFDDPEHYFLP